MTIEVHIQNKDAALCIEVVEQNYDKRQGTSSLGTPHRIEPGCSATFYCYHLRDLIVREVDPPVARHK